MGDYIPSFIIDPVLRQARRFSERISAEEQPTPASVASRDQVIPNSAPATSVPIELASSNSRFGLPNLPQFPGVPAVDFQRFYPSRFWNQSPPASAGGERKSTAIGLPADEDDAVYSQQESETTLQSIARNVQLWANEINNLDMFPSPPLEPVAVPVQRQYDVDNNNEATEHMVEFPALEVEVPQQLPPLSQVRDGREPLQPTRNDSETSLNPAHELPYRSQILDREVGRSHSDPLTAPNLGHDLIVQPPGNQDNASGMSRERDWSGSLPEDDGMGPLRRRINDVWTGSGTAEEKSRLVHALMTERYRRGQATKPQASPMLAAHHRPMSPSSISTISHEGTFNLYPADLEPTYTPVVSHDTQEDANTGTPKPILGCVHYKRNVKMQCYTCGKWYTCRLCHDEVEDHQLPRRETRHMLCMLCGTPQRVGQDCKMCGEQAACYYCPVCKLWNNDPEKSVYHCDDCGICRLGEGLGKDFFHCKTCAACMSIQAESTHRCIERSTKCDCPICGEYMFTSNKPVAFMRCGHSIHETCFAEWCNTSYKCPICSKSIANMESQFRRLDRHIEDQPMPEDYRNSRAYIFCNDCNSRSATKYHWLGLKCAVCDSYNTAQLELLGAESPQLQAQADQAQQRGVGEASMTASQSQTPTEELTQPALGADSGQITPSNTGSRPVSRSTADVELSPAASNFVNQIPSRRDSPFHAIPQSPATRPARGLSPIVGSYFNTGQARPLEENRRGSYFSVFSAGSARDNTEDIASTLSSRFPGNDMPRRRHSSRLSQSYQAEQQDTSTSLPGAATETHSASQTIPRRGVTPLEDDEDLDFWGGRSPRSYETDLVDIPGHDKDEESSSSEDDIDRMDQEDDDDDDDLMDILGHR